MVEKNVFDRAEWIGGHISDQADIYTEYRLSFTAAAGKVYALSISCDTEYALYRGDSLLAFGQYPDYPDYRVYDTVMLENFAVGEHQLSLIVWYQGVENASTYINKSAGVIFALTEDSIPILVSSPSILSRRAAGYASGNCRSITGQLGFSFTYDAEEEAGEWKASRSISGSRNLHPRPVKKLILQDRVVSQAVQCGGFIWREGHTFGEWMQNAALSFRTASFDLTGEGPIFLEAKKEENGIYVILDMGRESAGFVELDFSVSSSCRVIGGWGEHLTDGRCRTAIADRDFSFFYHAKSGKNHFLHPFRRFGGRYLQLFFETNSVELVYAGIRETVYPLNIQWSPSGNILRDRIAEVCINTLRQCMHEHYEDCPWREQALYTLDSRNQMLCGYLAFGETDFPRACLELISHGQRKDGLLSICYPAGVNLAIPSYSLAYFLQMREYLSYSSDLDFVREKYVFLCSLMEVFLKRQRHDGLIENFQGGGLWNFYEWSEGMSGSSQIDIDAPLNALLSLALQSLSYIAKAIGREKDAMYYDELVLQVNDSLQSVFYDPDVGLFRSYTKRCREEYSVLTNSLCLLCGAANDLDKSSMLDVILTNGKSDKGIMLIPATLSMNGFRFDALLQEDRKRFAEKILDELDRTYLLMLEKQSTSFWETSLGENDFDNAGSLCHGWSAIPIYYYMTLMPFYSEDSDTFLRSISYDN